jgi:predicted CXXCH cytochrome family protein
MRLGRILALWLAAAAPLAAQQNSRKSEILNSRHDFRASSSAQIRSVDTHDACIFCHTPHNANPGELLWNHQLSGQQLSGYQSSTLEATVGGITPADSSKLCLSCHDGSIALGETMNNGRIPFQPEALDPLPPNLPSNLAAGKGLSDDHPVAFHPSPGAKIRLPAAGDAVRLDAAGRLQCTSCHEPHEEYRDPVTGKFLVKQNQASALCLTCHTQPGWTTSSHRMPPDPVSNLRYTSQQGAHTGYTGISDNACESCHRPHSPQVEQRLVKFPEEQTCYACHDGSVASPGRNIRNEFQSKLYAHPVSVTPSRHDASESPVSPLFPLPETSSSTPRHAECADCHNAHFANPAAAQPPLVSGPLAGVSGYSAAGTFLPQSASEFEICFKCHADSANRPQLFDSSLMGIGFGRNAQRQNDTGNPDAFNTRAEFNFLPSYHPVTRPRNLSVGPGGEVPSLRSAPITPAGAPLPGRTLSPASFIYCTDCHNNDSGRNLGTLQGPAGPHGSNLPHLLERTHAMELPPATPGAASPGVSYSLAEYGLCNKCHDVEGSVLQNQSFPEHRRHVRQKNTACATCHDPHASNAPMLVNFDLSIVGPNRRGLLEYRRTGFRQGTCSLRCHGKDHDEERY